MIQTHRKTKGTKMDDHFDLLHKRLKLTSAQRAEVKRKYTGVSKSLYEEFYDGEYDKRTRLIIGSHGKKTESRSPIGDIDLIFKISKADLERYQAYDSNGPSALLARAKAKLEKTYPVTDKRSWCKVVLVEFTTGHDVEVLPCYENYDGTFTIPNSEDGGSWDTFDPRAEIRMIKESNDATGITRRLIKFIKRWNNKHGKTIKSFQIEFLCVSFLNDEYEIDMPWSQVIESFFVWLEFQSADLSDDAQSRVASAKGRAQKAREYELSGNLRDACVEWRKVFGDSFPVYDSKLSIVASLEKRYPSEVEEFIHERYPVRIDSSVALTIQPRIRRNGFRDFQLFMDYFNQGDRYLPKSASLVFKALSNLGGSANYLWKIRNLSEEAKSAGGLRGEIHKSNSQRTREEGTEYEGTHYIECYAIRAGVCVAVARIFVPIGEDQ
jgi:hypothetical protein